MAVAFNIIRYSWRCNSREPTDGYVVPARRAWLRTGFAVVQDSYCLKE